MSFRNKAVMVTGASRGLGEALARRFARAGAKLALVARGERGLSRVVEAIRAEGGEAHALAADVGDKQAILPLAGAAQALIGPIDVLIHDASTLGPTPLRLLLDTECEDFERVLAVNLVGPFRLTKALAGAMAVRGGGLVVHVTSDASVNAYAGWGAYSVSKAGLDHLARLFAVELDALGVRFLSVDPGEMDTAMHRDALPDADPSTLARPDAVAERILELVRRSDFTNGARLEVA